ncbi:MAG: hypothetical protein IKG21_13670, partial [Atopobiaceae bacterium]|nr:hypothetical protein [Atopobiaceae bacterium]
AGTRDAAGAGEEPGTPEARDAAGAGEEPGTPEARDAAGAGEEPGTPEARDAAGAGDEPGTPKILEESELVNVRTEGAAGFFVPTVQAGDYVHVGQELAQIRDAFDAHPLKSLNAPVNGRVFFMRKEPLVQQHMVVFRIVAT